MMAAAAADHTVFVISYRMSYADGICEISDWYRGSLIDCAHIIASFGGGSDERRPLQKVEVGLCTLQSWQEFVNSVEMAETL